MSVPRGDPHAGRSAAHRAAHDGDVDHPVRERLRRADGPGARSADGDDTITVTATDGGGATGPCALSVGGEIRWSGTCGDRARTRIAVGGLDSETTYTVVLTARNPDGTTTRTDPVSVTTD